MPRKQRFKPSRKPKPVQTSEITEIQPTGAENPSAPSEQVPTRPQEDRSARAGSNDDGGGA
jgi:hypothetical protein